MEDYEKMGLTVIKNKTNYMTMCYKKYCCSLYLNANRMNFQRVDAFKYLRVEIISTGNSWE